MKNTSLYAAALLLLFTACQKQKITQSDTALPTTQATAKRLQTLSGPIRTDSVYGVVVHFGQANNQDYTADKISYALSLARTMNLNYFRTDVSLDGNGNPNSTFQAFADSANNAGFGIVAVMNNPSVTVPANNSAYTTTELQNYYNAGYNKGYGFASRASLQGKIQFIQIFNELENDNNAGLKKDSYAGTQEPTIGQNDAKYDMTKYPAYFQFMLGAYTGIKTANSSIKVGTNYAWIHYGLFLKFSKDMLAQNKKLDFMLLNWYNGEEYGIDNTHNVVPNQDVPMAGQAINRLKYKFIQTPASPLVDQVGISETGISFGGGSTPNPNNLGKGGFLTLMHNQYKPQCNMFFYYELFKELVTRSALPKEAQFGIQISTNAPNHLVTDTLSTLH